jgi:hypothetical protein
VSDRGEELFRHRNRALLVVEVGEHDQEFVAAEARDRVAAPQRGLDAAGDDLEERIARGVAERVVHRLEVVRGR